jgi:hypothetical protein
MLFKKYSAMDERILKLRLKSLNITATLANPSTSQVEPCLIQKVS